VLTPLERFVTVLIVLLGRAVAVVPVLLYRPDLGVGIPSIRLNVRDAVIIVVVSQEDVQDRVSIISVLTQIWIHYSVMKTTPQVVPVGLIFATLIVQRCP